MHNQPLVRMLNEWKTMESERLNEAAIGKSTEGSPIGAGPAGGISGKRLTLAVLATLIGTGLLLTYTLYVYSQLDEARKRADAQWREVATLLDSRYRGAELAVAKGVDSGAVKMEFGEQFRLAIDGFRTTSDSTKQQQTAVKLEQLLASEAARLSIGGADSAAPLKSETPLLKSVEQYNADTAEITRILGTPGGKILDVFLGIPTPTPFEAP